MEKFLDCNCYNYATNESLQDFFVEHIPLMMSQVTWVQRSFRSKSCHGSLVEFRLLLFRFAHKFSCGTKILCLWQVCACSRQEKAM